MSNSRPWYKRYPADFINGCVVAGMNLEEIGAYTILLDLLYDRGEPVPNDPARLARMGGCSTRKWKAVCVRLINLGKIVEIEGYLDNPRASKQRVHEVFEGRKLAESGAKGGRKKAEKRRELKENNDLAEKGLPEKGKHTRSQSLELEGKTVVGTTTESKIERTVPDTTNVVSDETTLAFEAYNLLAEKIGLPKAQKLNKRREGRLRQRLKDCGGIEGWNVAMEKVEASAFLSGAKTSFTANLDFILQESSFTKLMEGNYDNRRTEAAGRGNSDPEEDTRRRHEAIHRAFRPGSQPGETMVGGEPERRGGDPYECSG